MRKRVVIFVSVTLLGLVSFAVGYPLVAQATNTSDGSPEGKAVLSGY